MTKEYKQYLFVETSGGFYGYSIVETANKKTGKKGMAIKVSDRVGDYELIMLPPGSYSIVGLANELSREQKAIMFLEVEEIVNNETALYKVYGKYYDEPSHERMLSTSDPNKAFDSLLSHLGLSKQVLIIKKEEK